MLKKINTQDVIKKTEDAIDNYSKYIKNNELLASENVKVIGNTNSDKCTVEYNSENGNFKVSVNKKENKVTVKADFNNNKYNAVAKNNEVDIKGIAPLHSEHWSIFNKIFEEDNEFLI